MVSHGGSGGTPIEGGPNKASDSKAESKEQRLENRAGDRMRQDGNGKNERESLNKRDLDHKKNDEDLRSKTPEEVSVLAKRGAIKATMGDASRQLGCSPMLTDGDKTVLPGRSAEEIKMLKKVEQVAARSAELVDHSKEVPFQIPGQDGTGIGYSVGKNKLAKGDEVDQYFANKPNESFNCMDYALNKASGHRTWMDNLGLGQAQYVGPQELKNEHFKQQPTDANHLQKGDFILVTDKNGISKHAGVVEGFEKSGNPIIREKLSSGKEGVYDQDFNNFAQTWTGGDLNQIQVWRKEKEH